MLFRSSRVPNIYSFRSQSIGNFCIVRQTPGIGTRRGTHTTIHIIYAAPMTSPHLSTPFACFHPACPWSHSRATRAFLQKHSRCSRATATTDGYPGACWRIGAERVGGHLAREDRPRGRGISCGPEYRGLLRTGTSTFFTRSATKAFPACPGYVEHSNVHINFPVAHSARKSAQPHHKRVSTFK